MLSSQIQGHARKVQRKCRDKMEQFNGQTLLSIKERTLFVFIESLLIMKRWLSHCMNVRECRLVVKAL